ncbi:MAG: PD-(D/E)XK nuclease family protein [Cyanobacteriota bacterium]
MIRKISSTQFLEYQICPLYYYYKYIKNFNKISFDTKDEAKKGEEIHKIIDFYSKGINLPEEYINSDPHIKKVFDFYVEKHHKTGENVKNEFEFNLPFFINEEKYFLVGRIDRIILEKDKATIIDWKTGEKFSKASNIKNFLQLDFYAYVVSEYFGIKDIELKIAYLSAEKDFSRKINSEKLKNIQKSIQDMILNTKIERKHYTPAPIDIDKDIPFCKICNFSDFCTDFI